MVLNRESISKRLLKAKTWFGKKKKIFLAVLIVPVLLFLLFGFYNLYFASRIYPNTYIAGIKVGGLTPKEASDLINEKTSGPNGFVINNHESVSVNLADLDFSYNTPTSVNRAYEHTRNNNLLTNLYTRIWLLTNSQDFDLEYTINQEKLEETLSIVAGQAGVPAVYPSARLIENEIVIEKGAVGLDVSTKILKEKISERLSRADFSPITLSTTPIDPRIDDTQAEEARKRASKLIGKSLTLNFEYQSFLLTDSDLVGIIDPKGGYGREALETVVLDIKQDIERSPQNPFFTFENEKVTEFKPAKDGILVRDDDFYILITGSLDDLENGSKQTISILIPTVKAPPEYDTDDVNDLGIRELIGRGTSNFAGSISSRIHNIVLASANLNGVLIPPGEIFSFNDALGDVTSYTGYKQAYVIMDGKTILGDGGGVCQVSTTFFRAALDAGLPIVERRAHSYRVSYYEKDSSPGFDATVYSPYTDIKIKNDTPGHILIQTISDTQNTSLVFEFYGTSDGRIAETTKPIVTNVIPPPEDLYTDDPALPVGTTKQIERKNWGADVYFDYLVTRNGETLQEKTFYSKYRPWQAVYLVGTAPVQQ